MTELTHATPSTDDLVAAIDQRLVVINDELRNYDELIAERARLAAARRALVPGAEREDVARRITREDVLHFVQTHPGNTANDVAAGLGVPYGTANGHLSRGRGDLYDKHDGRWYLRVTGPDSSEKSPLE